MQRERELSGLDLGISGACGLGLVALGLLAACSRSDGPTHDPGKDPARTTIAPALGPTPTPGASSSGAVGVGAAGVPQLPPEVATPTPPPSASASAEVASHPPPPEWSGPWLTITEPSAAFYADAHFSKDRKLGYARSGGRVPVKAEIAGKEGCSGGWYAGVDGGFVCSNGATLSSTDTRLKFTITPPNLEDILPYRYARNAKNGTPLYRSIPSPDQIRQYEPYLNPEKTEEDQDVDASTAKHSAESESPEKPTGRETSGNVSEGDPTEPSKPWWQETDGGSNLHEVTLERMREEADGILEMRMMRGFYVAVDKTFRWNNRLWYKTTKGLVAPADRLGQVDGSKFKGVDLAGDVKLPMAWVPGARKNATLYALDGESLKPKRTIEQWATVQLTGVTKEIARNTYWETVDGLMVKDGQVRVALAAEPPQDITPGERWVDVNVSQQSLVAYEGTKAVYATLVSTGKESKIKDKDHRTPRGSFRVREKHVTTTMDGDGTAAGDLPYSIEDVPYVLYFHRSYALHGAFWHRNFGTQMSHGCVNIAPLDAKWLFFFLDPQLPRGWHGVWSSPSRPGSRVVIHE